MIYPKIKKMIIVDVIKNSREISYGYLNRGFECRPKVKFNNDFIPMMDYSNYDYCADLGAQYNLASICQYGLEMLFSYKKSGNKEDLLVFEKILFWMINQSKENNHGIFWEYGYNYCDVKKPWVSSQVNGLMLSIFTNAYKLFGELNYLSLSSKTARFYNVSIDDGGFLGYYNKNIIFQQYTNCDDWRRFGLNGFLISLIGLAEYSIIARNDMVSNDLLNKGIDSFIKLHKVFEKTPFWTSLYPVKDAGVSSSIDYHIFHYELLYCLAVITKNYNLYNIYLKWALIPPVIARYFAKNL